MFSDNETIDYFEIMALVDSFVEANSASIAINEDKLFSMIKRIHADFPCINGGCFVIIYNKLIIHHRKGIFCRFDANIM
jgi:hypothetical protein